MTGEASREPDLSVVMAIHQEAALIQRTLLSLAATICDASAAGYRTEVIFARDRSDPETKQIVDGFHTRTPAKTCILDLDFGCPGLTRTAAMHAATGRLIAIADADDLVASDFLSRTIIAADRFGPKVLVVPQWLLAFGVDEHIAEFLPLAEVGPRAFFGGHPFVHRICGHRAEMQARRYVNARRDSAEGFEDWHFNAEAVADGFDIQPAEGAILFYRSNVAGRMAADRRAKADLPRCTLFAPEIYAGLPASPPARPFDAAATRKRLLAVPKLMPRLLEANAIDPGIQPTLTRQAPIFNNRSWLRPSLDAAYSDMTAAIGTRQFSEVFLLPFISTGGADRYVEDIMWAMYAIHPTRPILVVLGEPLTGGSDITRVPPHTAVVDITGDYPYLSPQERDLMTLRLLRSTAPTARIHMRPSPFVDQFMASYGAAITAHPLVYYRFGEPAGLIEDKVHTLPYGFHFVAAHLPHLNQVVADNPNVIARDRLRFGLWPERWHLLRSRMSPSVDEALIEERLATTKHRMLWASRPDAEKRPELLRPLAGALSALSPISRIDAYGNAVLGGFNTASLANTPGLKFHGAHAGFETLDHSLYDAFIYTSWFDGLPIVLLEAAAHGLPIIAPDVGAISGFVVANETGLLLPSLPNGKAMAEAYASAIVELQRDPALRIRLAIGALRRLRDVHSPDAHRANVAAVFELGRPERMGRGKCGTN
ncbi:glycosyltransferase [Plastoroseomonas hellenica]|uniref:glycosyltransferase n=1 Tax=Plastoroseomonas hellenica TaxID=2687306 RepID=UPI001BA9A46E|nr:glycosyltransferase [Plastoroseomonas hellenica]MBR0641453.1 glycosyltransferase [Plastoroseomonas hellenica]